MPWCDSCDHYVADDNTLDDGEGGRSCPDCGAELDNQDLTSSQAEGAPWHFWLLVIAVAIYLGWRLLQAIIWLVGRAT